MALFKAQVFKQRGTERPWTNVYHIGADSIGLAALAAVTYLGPWEASILDSSITVFKIITSDPASDDFINDALSLVGTQSIAAALLPLFNTMRLFVRVDGFGRNDSKFYRGFCSETNTQNSLIDGTILAGVVTGFNQLMTDMSGNDTPLLADDEAAWLLGTGQQAVQMRQLHRKRKSTGGFARAKSR